MQEAAIMIQSGPIDLTVDGRKAGTERVHFM